MNKFEKPSAIIEKFDLKDIISSSGTEVPTESTMPEPTGCDSHTPIIWD